MKAGVTELKMLQKAGSGITLTFIYKMMVLFQHIIFEMNISLKFKVRATIFLQ